VAKITLTPLNEEDPVPDGKEKITLSEIKDTTTSNGTDKTVLDSKNTIVSEFLLKQAESEGLKLYGIVDSARNEEVFRYLILGNVKYKSLFEGTMDIQSFVVSGFLVECKKDSLLFQWLATEAWGDSSCIFFTSKSSFEDLFHHFQQFNRVRLEDDKVVLFRYYDPRVLRKLLPDYNEFELDTFFGDVQSFFAEGEDPSVVDVFQKGDKDGKTVLLVTRFSVDLSESTRQV